MNTVTKSDYASRFQEQVTEYEYPYHYIPSERDGAWFLHRHLGWGMEYLAVLTEVRKQVLALGPKRLLDVGTGDARLPFELANHAPDLQVTGVDPVAQAVAYGRAFCLRFGERVQIIEGVVDDLDQGDFDVATAMEVLEHIPDSILPDLIRAVRRRLSEHGRFVVSVPTIVRPTHPKHERHYTQELLAQQLEPWFTVERVLYVYREGLRQRLLNKLLLNRIGLLTLGPLIRRIHRWHQSSVVPADEDNGTHLIAVCRAQDPA